MRLVSFALLVFIAFFGSFFLFAQGQGDPNTLASNEALLVPFEKSPWIRSYNRADSSGGTCGPLFMGDKVSGRITMVAVTTTDSTKIDIPVDSIPGKSYQLVYALSGIPQIKTVDSTRRPIAVLAPGYTMRQVQALLVHYDDSVNYQNCLKKPVPPP